MKKLYTILVILGLLILAGIIVISAVSGVVSDRLKTYGFITFGYLGVIIFTYGWSKRSSGKE